MWHPENYQTEFHRQNWQAITERPYVWGSFIWNLFDFGAAHRTEGDRYGINDKGLVSFDRKVKKTRFISIEPTGTMIFRLFTSPSVVMT